MRTRTHPNSPSPLLRDSWGLTKEEKKKKKRDSSGSLYVDVKKKRVAIWVRKSIKRSTKCKVPDSNSFYQIRDYHEDDNLEFIANESTINEGEKVVIGKGDQEVDLALTRES